MNERTLDHQVTSRARRWRLLGGAAALAALVIVIAIVFRPPPPAPRPLPEFDWTIADAEVATAVEQAAAEVRRAPESAAAWGRLGMVLLANKLEVESTSPLGEAERLDPRDPRWPYLTGIALAAPSPEEAIACLDRAAKCVDADQSQSAVRCGAAHLRLAELLAANGRQEEAAAHYEQVPAGPLGPAAEFGLGVIAVSRGELDEARRLWLRCLQSPTTRQKAAVQLAALARRLGDSQATQLGQQAGQFPPDTSWPDPFLEECLELLAGRASRQRHANFLESQGQIDRSLDVLRDLARDYPDTTSYSNVGIVLGRRGFHRESEQYLRKCLELEPQLLRAQYYLSLALFGQAETLRKQAKDAEATMKFEEAARWARSATELAPGYGEAHFQLGLSLWCLERRDDAIAAFRAAVANRPELVDGHLWLGRLLAESQEWAEAEQHLRDAARYADPRDPRPGQALEELRRRNANGRQR